MSTYKICSRFTFIELLSVLSNRSLYVDTVSLSKNQGALSLYIFNSFEEFEEHLQINGE